MGEGEGEGDRRQRGGGTREGVAERDLDGRLSSGEDHLPFFPLMITKYFFFIINVLVAVT